MLIPRAEKLPFYSGSLENDDLRYEYERYRCSENFYEGQNLATIPEVCRENHLGSIGLYVYGQAFCKLCDFDNNLLLHCNMSYICPVPACRTWVRDHSSAKLNPTYILLNPPRVNRKGVDDDR